MFEMAESFYKLHYREAISPNLSEEQKREVAERISALTLQSPIWQDGDTDYADQFPELRPYVNAKLSGLYLCAILGGIVAEFQTSKERS